jgi:hypothetical protein
MAEEQFRVGLYLAARRAFAAQPGGADSNPEGRMPLFPHPDDPTSVGESLLFFRGPFGGDVVSNGTTTAVRSILPPEEFEQWYRILRAEEPVFLVWEKNPDDSLLMVGLSSGRERPGERFG